MKLNMKEPYLSLFSSLLSTLGENSFMVGGFVRDTLLQRETHDMDFATDVSLSTLSSLLPNSEHFLFVRMVLISRLLIFVKKAIIKITDILLR